MRKIAVFLGWNEIGHTFVPDNAKVVLLHHLQLGSIHTVNVPLSASGLRLKLWEQVDQLSNFFPDSVSYELPHKIPSINQSQWQLKETDAGTKRFLIDRPQWVYTPNTGEEAERLFVRYSSAWHLLCEGETHEVEADRLIGCEFWSLQAAQVEAQRRAITLNLQAEYSGKEIGRIQIEKGAARFHYTEFPTKSSYKLQAPLLENLIGLHDWDTVQEVINRYYWEYEQDKVNVCGN